MRTYALEMMLATLMVACGIGLVWHGDTFALPHYGIMRQYIREVPGGAFLLIVGCVRWWAIMRNGGARYTPLLRIGGCAIGCGFWLTLSLALESALVVSTGDMSGPPLMLPVSITAALFETFAALRGGGDAFRQDSLRLREGRFRPGARE